MKYMQAMTNTEVPYDSQGVLRCTLHDSIFLLLKRDFSTAAGEVFFLQSFYD